MGCNNLFFSGAEHKMFNMLKMVIPGSSATGARSRRICLMWRPLKHFLGRGKPRVEVLCWEDRSALPHAGDYHWNIIDGGHRFGVDEKWRRIRLEHIETEGDRLIARIVSNIVRIRVSRDGSKIRNRQAVRNIRGFDGWRVTGKG